MGMRRSWARGEGRKRRGAQFDFLACKRVDTKLASIFSLTPYFIATVLGLRHSLVNRLENQLRIKCNETKSKKVLWRSRMPGVLSFWFRWMMPNDLRYLRGRLGLLGLGSLVWKRRECVPYDDPKSSLPLIVRKTHLHTPYNMRLINTRTLRLEEFFGTIPEYAILSHTWGREEVTFEEFSQGQGTTKPGYDKITAACRKARNHGIDYCWVDTCCIAKSSSAELSEAINSMFNWYKQAKTCYVFLFDLDSADVNTDGTNDDTAMSITARLARCRWYTRGWCLQELIAPKELRFYDRNWKYIGTKSSLTQSIFDITGIDHDVLEDSSRLFVAPIARRMSWASKRETTRVEDMAYSLLGIFDVNMPMLYGEGKKAFIRLQEEIIKKSNDLSIFAWTPDSQMGDYLDMFASSPAFFDGCHDVVTTSQTGHVLPQIQFSISNRGLLFVGAGIRFLELGTARELPGYGLSLGCLNRKGDTDDRKALFLNKIGAGLYVRMNAYEHIDELARRLCRPWIMEKEIYILPKVTADLHPIFSSCHRSSFELRIAKNLTVGGFGPIEAYDIPQTRFLTQGDSSFAAYLKMYVGKSVDLKREPFFVTLGFRSSVTEPFVSLVHADVWSRYDIQEGVLEWIVLRATEKQESISGGHELNLATVKVTASLHTRESRGFPVHIVVLSLKPHVKDQESTASWHSTSV